MTNVILVILALSNLCFGVSLIFLVREVRALRSDLTDKSATGSASRGAW